MPTDKRFCRSNRQPKLEAISFKHAIFINRDPIRASGTDAKAAQRNTFPSSRVHFSPVWRSI
jgi:hypothetical protein